VIISPRANFSSGDILHELTAVDPLSVDFSARVTQKIREAVIVEENGQKYLWTNSFPGHNVSNNVYLTTVR